VKCPVPIPSSCKIGRKATGGAPENLVINVFGINGYITPEKIILIARRYTIPLVHILHVFKATIFEIKNNILVNN
jgi:hypothetical protein